MDNTEGRAAKRLRVLKSAKIVFNLSQSMVDCTVRDLSDTGAKLLLSKPTDVPDEFRIVFTQDNTIRDAQVKWRKAEQLGIVFTSEAKRAPPLKFKG
jgi:hypothetical protein